MQLKILLPMVFSALLFTSHVSTHVGSEKHSSFIGTETKYHAEEGRIRITMPSDYSVSVVEGDLSTTTKVTSTIGETTYMFSWTLHKELMEGHKGLADVSLESFNKELKGEINTQNVYKYGKYEGKNAKITIMQGQARCFYRVVLIGQYQFQMIVATTDAEIDKTGMKFLDSFKYKNK
tara:strand:+ start:2233 stop:2766 length:534 start_codon:yes stop_codon:yes gene_type:complete